MKISMNGLRRNITYSANQIGSFLQDKISTFDSDDQNKTIDLFNELAMHLSNLNAVYNDEKDFDDLSEKISLIWLLSNNREKT